MARVHAKGGFKYGQTNPCKTPKTYAAAPPMMIEKVMIQFGAKSLKNRVPIPEGDWYLVVVEVVDLVPASIPEKRVQYANMDDWRMDCPCGLD